MYDWKGQADVLYSDDDVDKMIAKAAGRGAAFGAVLTFFVMLAVFAVIGAYL